MNFDEQGRSAVKPSRIAVLGAGPASMAAVYNILKANNWNKDLVDITVYQQGWRIGGKCASGRNMEKNARVEEHGIHFWFGSYHNSFAWIKECYAKLHEIGYPGFNWENMLIEAPSYVGYESLPEGWDTWEIKPFAWPFEPGTGNDLYGTSAETSGSIADFAHKGLQLLQQHLAGLQKTLEPTPPASLLHNLLDRLKSIHHSRTQEAIDQVNDITGHFSAIKQSNSFGKDHPTVIGLLTKLEDLLTFNSEVFFEYLESHQVIRRIFVVIDLGITILKGLLVDEVFNNGLDSINYIDFIDWLRKNGAADITLKNTLVTSYYDGAFAYRDGDKRFPNSEAGTTLRGILIALLTCNKSMFWKFRGSMAEVVFTPYYLLLKHFGVKFKFFHKVQNLVLSADKKRVASIRMEEQVHLKPGSGEYDPLVEVKGVRCWPSAPKYELIEEGEQLRLEKQQNYNLESFWTAWKGTDKSLHEGEDFDQVIFGIPVGSVPYLCTELIEASTAWREMTGALETVLTQSLQLWVTKSEKELGWQYPQSTIYTTYTEPLNTWCSNPDLVPLEEWPVNGTPEGVSFFTGVLRDPAQTPLPSFSGYPKIMHEKVQSQFLQFLVNNFTVPFPRAKPSTGLNDWFNWTILHELAPAIGHNRLYGQYIRANVDPSERYVLSVANSSRYRLATDGTGFDNLLVTGDWIRTPLNCGCFEGALMAGILTARAVTHQHIPIMGEFAFKMQERNV